MKEKHYFCQNLNPDLLHERQALYLCTIRPWLQRRNTFESKFKRGGQKGPPSGLKLSNHTSDPIGLMVPQKTNYIENKDFIFVKEKSQIAFGKLQNKS